MTASELNRKLLYHGYDDLVDYFRNSPLNRLIYQVLLHHGPKPSPDTPMLTVFNEAYYQLARINYDPNPGIDIAHRYLDEEQAYLGSRKSAMVVFSVVWALIRRKWHENTSFNEKCFEEAFYPVLGKDKYERLSYILIKFSAGERLMPAKRPRTMPTPVSELPFPETSGDKDAWREVTNDFSYKTIERLLRLYATPDEQHTLLNLIEGALPEDVAKIVKANMTKLRTGINAGKYPQDVSDEEDYSDGMELTYKEELERLKKRYERLKQSKEREASLRESELESELYSLREQLEQKAISLQKHRYGVYYFSATEMINHVKQNFSKAAADEFSLMLYQLAVKHGYIEEGICMMIDDIVPAVLKRESLRQTIEIKDPNMVNINPQKVENRSVEKKKTTPKGTKK